MNLDQNPQVRFTQLDWGKSRETKQRSCQSTTTWEERETWERREKWGRREGEVKVNKKSLRGGSWSFIFTTTRWDSFIHYFVFFLPLVFFSLSIFSKVFSLDHIFKGHFVCHINLPLDHPSHNWFGPGVSIRIHMDSVSFREFCRLQNLIQPFSFNKNSLLLSLDLSAIPSY